MANVKLGSNAKWNSYAQNLDSDYQMLVGDAGKTFFADQTNAVKVNLPELSSVSAGWGCTIILDVEGSATVSVVAYGLPLAGGTTGDAESVTYREYPRDGSGGGNATNCDGFDINTNAVIGHRVDIITNGTRWFASSFQGAGNHGANIDTD
tara:strand:+ start:487 stop:939 length:453 start_codon:yes stop_codon:yes gene_type:complete